MHSASSIPSGPIMSTLNMSGVVNVVSPHSAGILNSVPATSDPSIMFPSSSIIILHTVIDPFLGMVVVVDEVVEVDVVLVLVVGIVVVSGIVVVVGGIVEVDILVVLIVVVVSGICTFPNFTSTNKSGITSISCVAPDVASHPLGTSSFTVYVPTGIHVDTNNPPSPVIASKLIPGPSTSKLNPGSGISPVSHTPFALVS